MTKRDMGRVARAPRRRNAVATVAGAAVVALVGGSCAGEAGGMSDWGGRIDSLPGGGVRVVNPAEGIWSEDDAWRLTETLRLGALEGEGPELFGDVADIQVDGAGNLYVLEGQAHELRVFAPDGSHLRTIGREGSGPGELNVSVGGEVLLEPDGRIWVNNAMNRRWELFTAEGSYVSSTPQQTRYFGAQSVLAADGAVYQRDQVRPAGASESWPAMIRKAIRGDSLVVTDTVRAPELPEDVTVSVSLSAGANQISMRLPVPFVHQPSWKFDRAGYFWVERGDGYRLVALTPGGDTLRIVERAYEPVPVTRAELDAALEGFASGGLEESGADLDRSEIPGVHPPFGDYRSDTVGNLWVRRTLGMDRWAWDVFDPEGIYLGEVRHDVDLDRLQTHLITDAAVYGVLRDDLDIPFVVRFAIEKGG